MTLRLPITGNAEVTLKDFFVFLVRCSLISSGDNALICSGDSPVLRAIPAMTSLCKGIVSFLYFGHLLLFVHIAFKPVSGTGATGKTDKQFKEIVEECFVPGEKEHYEKDRKGNGDQDIDQVEPPV